MNAALNINKNDIRSLFCKRDRMSHKGTYGDVLCVCGSYNPKSAMCGAAFLSAVSAYRCGAGIVRIYTHKENYVSLSTLLPEAVFELYGTGDEDSEMARLRELAASADCVLVGCGLSMSEYACRILKVTLESAKKHLVIDADALNIMSKDESLFDLISCPYVITPHIKEMSRLTGLEVADIVSDREGTARGFALKHGAVCVLKDAYTVTDDGTCTYVNLSGSPAMAKAGSGDVLSGVIAGLLAQKGITCKGSVAYIAACGVYLHGLAGEIAGEKLGEYSVLARDISSALPMAIRAK